MMHAAFIRSESDQAELSLITLEPALHRVEQLKIPATAFNSDGAWSGSARQAAGNRAHFICKPWHITSHTRTHTTLDVYDNMFSN